MDIHLRPDTYFIFDLDDTLYAEVDFLKSAFRYINRQYFASFKEDISEEIISLYHSGENVFEWLIKRYGSRIPDLSIARLLKMYREHKPEIQLSPDAEIFLKLLALKNIPSGLITDGRSITQRNKLKALGLESYFKDIIISGEFGSEKPNEMNFLYFEKKYYKKEFWFIGDNTSKDFDVPSKLGWNVICLLDNGNNIHSQDLNECSAQFKISSFNEIILK